MTQIDLVRGQMGVEIKGEYYNVHPLPYDPRAMVEDEAYISGDVVMPFRGFTDKIDSNRPGYYVYREKDDSIKLVINLPEKEEEHHYSVNKVINFEISSILEQIKKEDFISPEEIERINMNSDFRHFDIHPDDDFLKKIVKSIINTKKVNLKIYANRLPERHHLGNMISSLSGKTKMSVTYFNLWGEILGFDFDIIARDNGTDNIVPLDKDVTYSSVTNDIE